MSHCTYRVGLLRYHTVAVIKHSMHVIQNAVQHLSPGQTAPVVTFDQPLFALAKQIQWKWPQEYGEQKFVIIFDGSNEDPGLLAARKRVGASAGSGRDH